MTPREPVYRRLDSELVRTVADESIGLRGFLVVHSRVNGRSCGGLRIHDDVTVDELRDHAKVMELKQAFLGLPRGGARAGIVAPYGLPEERKLALVKRFGELVADELRDRKWLAAIDVGSNQRLIQAMYRHVGVDIPAPSQEIDNAGYYTALGVLRSVEISLGLQGRELRDCTFAVEGFGHVGSHLALLLHERGARVVAISTAEGAVHDPAGLPVPELFERRRVDGLGTPPGATRLPSEAVPELDVDVLCPCARDATIHTANVERVRASVVCAGANNPVTLPADEHLHRRGVLYLPDFMTNAGGALGNMVRFAGLSDRYFHRLIAKEFTDKILEVHRISQALSSTPREAGIRWADEKFARMKAGKERRSSSNGLFELALSIYRKGVVPPVLLRPLTFRHMRALIAS